MSHENVQDPQTAEQVKRMIGIFHLYKAFIPDLSNKWLSKTFYIHSKKVTFENEEEHKFMSQIDGSL